MIKYGPYEKSIFDKNILDNMIKDRRIKGIEYSMKNIFLLRNPKDLYFFP
jgi:hypothetical protein